MARLWDSSRTMSGGYSLEALTSNRSLMKGFVHGEDGAKTSMKKLFEKPNIKADGTPGKVRVGFCYCLGPQRQPNQAGAAVRTTLLPCRTRDSVPARARMLTSAVAPLHVILAGSSASLLLAGAGTNASADCSMKYCVLLMKRAHWMKRAPHACAIPFHGLALHACS